MSAEAEGFRQMMSRWATGVSVVTSHAGGTDAGLTVNAFLSVSLRPPLVLISLTLDADSTPVVRSSRSFVVNLLAHDQRGLSERFARVIPPSEKFRDLAVRRTAEGAAVLAGTLGALRCRVLDERVVADHVLFIAEVVEVLPGRDAAPLLFFHSGYAEAVGERRLDLPASKT